MNAVFLPLFSSSLQFSCFMQSNRARLNVWTVNGVSACNDNCNDNYCLPWRDAIYYLDERCSLAEKEKRIAFRLCLLMASGNIAVARSDLVSHP